MKKSTKKTKGVKLKIELYQFQNQLFGRIVEQDESLRGVGWVLDGIWTLGYPELIGQHLYIRGKVILRDHDWFHDVYGSPGEASLRARQIVAEVNLVNGAAKTKLPRLKKSDIPTGLKRWM